MLCRETAIPQHHPLSWGQAAVTGKYSLDMGFHFAGVRREGERPWSDIEQGPIKVREVNDVDAALQNLSRAYYLLPIEIRASQKTIMSATDASSSLSQPAVGTYGSLAHSSQPLRNVSIASTHHMTDTD